MTKIPLDNKLILVPHNLIERHVLFCLGLFIGTYEKTCEQECYPTKRRFTIDF